MLLPGATPKRVVGKEQDRPERRPAARPGHRGRDQPRRRLNRMGIYAALGVPEVWRFDGEALRIEQLQADGTYREVTASPGLPFLPPEEVVRWLRRGEDHGADLLGPAISGVGPQRAGIALGGSEEEDQDGNGHRTEDEAPSPEQRFLLPNMGLGRGTSRMLKMVGDSPIRVTYDRGDLELMSPSSSMEEYPRIAGPARQDRRRRTTHPVPRRGLTTWRRRAKDRGLEADACFYLASFPRVSGKRKKLDLNVDPPPDLAIEIEISRSAPQPHGHLRRAGRARSLAVRRRGAPGRAAPGRRHLSDGGRQAELPLLAPEEVVRWVRQAETIEDRGEWLRQLQAWIREELAPRSGAVRR